MSTFLSGEPARAAGVSERESVHATWLIQSRGRTLIFLEFTAMRLKDSRTGRTFLDVNLQRRRCREGADGASLRCRSVSSDIFPVRLLSFDVSRSLDEARAIFQVQRLRNRIRWTRLDSSPPVLFSYEGQCQGGLARGHALRQRASVSGRVLGSRITQDSSPWNRFWLERGFMLSQC